MIDFPEAVSLNSILAYRLLFSRLKRVFCWQKNYNSQKELSRNEVPLYNTPV